MNFLKVWLKIIILEHYLGLYQFESLGNNSSLTFINKKPGLIKI